MRAPFRHAAKRFAQGDNPGAASQIRVASALLSLEAGREHTETQNALRSSADALDHLAGRVEHGDVSSRNELNTAFAHADLALAAHYRAMADEAIAKKEHDNAGRWLEAAAELGRRRSTLDWAKTADSAGRGMGPGTRTRN